MKKPILRTIIVALVIISMFQASLYSQAVRDDKKTDTKITGKETPATGSEPDELDPFRDRKYPGIGLLLGINMPMGEIGKALAMGYGGLITAGMTLPAKLGRSANLAGRLHAGYYTLPGGGNDFTGTVTMIPFTASLELFFFTEGGVRPYFSLGGGVSYLTLSGDAGENKISNASSVDGTLAFNCGIGYTAKNMPDVEFMLNYTFLMVFEKVIGQFSMVSLGAQYRFRPVQDSGGGTNRSAGGKGVKPLTDDKAPKKDDKKGK